MLLGPHLQDEQQERIRKSNVLAVVIAGLFIVLLIRLVVLQIVQAQKNIQLSLENRMQLKVLKAPRGLMLDRFGRELVLNRPSFSICVLPYKVKRRGQLVSRLCRIRTAEGEPVFDSLDLMATLRRAAGRRFDATPIREDVSMDVISVIEEHSADFPGVVVETESRREYVLGPSAFHALGYISEIPEDQFDSLKNEGYHYGDVLGKAGLEKQYENDLRGVDGQEFVEVNAHGQVLGAIGDLPRLDPMPGNDLWLTLRSDLQLVTAKAFPDSFKGAVVVLDPRNGDVLVMYSNPSVDPNIFSMAPAQRSKQWAAVAADPSLPLNNRAIQGTYSPGSTFKLISALSGLECNELHAGSTMPRGCTGSYRIGGRIAHCWKETGHGRLSLIPAIQQSCNVYFYQVGLKVGDKNIIKYAILFGLGGLTGIDLPQEKEGWMSGEEAYNKRFAKRGWIWTGGLVLDLAIGQAQVVTPLQLAVMVGAMGNTEHRYRPHLVREIRAHDGAVVRTTRPESRATLHLKPETIETMLKALKSVVEPGGTGGRSAVPGISVGGKTGSAQNPQGELTHGLFAACAPVEKPVIAVAVVLENAGHGGSVAAPVAGEILRYFFARDPEGRRLWDQLNPQGDTGWMANVPAP